MHKQLYVIYAVILFMAMLAVAQAEGKVTVDPNIGGAANEPAEKVLDKAITYSAVGKRFYDITDDLAQISGLAISCGRDKNDWRVRDIPVDVAVKDMPLSKLLKALEWTTHTYCARAEHEGKLPTFRFYRDTRGKHALSGPQINSAVADWAWDALSAYSTKSDIPLDIDQKSAQIAGFSGDQIKLTADFIASLKPEIKQKVLKGEQVTLKVADSAQSAVLKDLYKSAWASRQDQLGSACRDLAESDIQRATVSVKLVPAQEYDSNEGFCILLFPAPERMGDEIDMSCVWNARPVQMAKLLQTDKRLDISPCPASGVDAAESDAASLAGFRLLEKNGSEWWELPALKVKVNLEQPGRKKPMHLTDVLPLLSKASGINIICEDFVSQQRSNRIGYRADRERTVGNVLVCATDEIDCYIDKECTTILGRSDNWRKAHLSLVQESLLNSIESKRNGDGAELDDVLPVAGLSTEQFRQWIGSAPDPLCIVEPVYMTGRWMWRLYESLRASDRKRAKSAKGFPLSRFDPVELRDFILQDSKDASSDSISLRLPTNEEQRQAKILSDPDTLKTLVMHVVEIPLDSWITYQDPVPSQTGHPRRIKHTSAEGIKRHTYEIRITGEGNDGKINLSSRWYNIIFPNYTHDREAELMKKLNARGK